MRNLMKELRVGLRQYPRLHGALRVGKAAFARVHPSEIQHQHRRRAERIQTIEQQVQRIEAGRRVDDPAPVLFLNASSDPFTLSFNIATGLVASWGLRVAGQPVTYLVCQGGIGKCVKGTDRAHPEAPPPCSSCVKLHSTWYPAERSVALLPASNANRELTARLGTLTLDELAAYRYGDLNIGGLCLPSARWILRRSDLPADPAAQPVLASYVASAIGLARQLDELFRATRPRALVAFNGTFFPEATARAVALARKIPVVTYEAGYRTLSAFFTSGVATEYPVHIPESFHMGPAEDAELDQYLARRTQGDFTMGGVRFWPEMKGVSPELKAKVEAHRQVVTVFTNVVYDTSQTYVNTIFGGMFEWLSETLKLAAQYPDTLFIVRAHPDELRLGRESQEPIEQWLGRNGPRALKNLVFIPPTEYVSSYELIGLSRFCIVYNSTVGLEAVLLGVPVLTGGLTRYAQAGAAHSPADGDAYVKLLGEFLRDGPPPIPRPQLQAARRYMYYSIFRVGLNLSAFIEPLEPSEYTVGPIEAEDLHPDRSAEMGIIYDGIIHDRPFCYA